MTQVAERRLAAVADQWRIPGVAPLPDTGPLPDLPGPRTAPVVSWTRSAIRGLALLLAVALVLAGYWVWSGRPRAVAMAPRVLATGPVLTTDGAAIAMAPGVDGVNEPEVDAGVPTAPADHRAAAAPAVQELVVHVTGLVTRPGLVRLPPGARVADAVSAAGGVTRRRASDSVNLARLVVDGEQIVVGGPAPPPAAGSPTEAGVSIGSGPLDLNSASAADLEELPGIGPVIAARIVQWRVVNGVFRSVEELGEVSGIGVSILSQVRSLVRV